MYHFLMQASPSPSSGATPPLRQHAARVSSPPTSHASSPPTASPWRVETGTTSATRLMWLALLPPPTGMRALLSLRLCVYSASWWTPGGTCILVSAPPRTLPRLLARALHAWIGGMSLPPSCPASPVLASSKASLGTILPLTSPYPHLPLPSPLGLAASACLCTSSLTLSLLLPPPSASLATCRRTPLSLA